MDLFVPVQLVDGNILRREKKILPLFIRQLYQRKNAVYRLLKRYKTDALKAKFKLAETKCKEAYTTYVTSKENGLIECGNLGSFYLYINSKLVQKTGIGVLIENGSYIYDDQTKAKILNDFYASVFISDNNVLPYSHSRVNDDCFICDVPFFPDRVFSLLTKLKPSTSGGPGGLSAICFKNVAGSLAIPLSLLFRTSYELLTLPTIWNSAIVTPVFKKGSLSSRLTIGLFH